jgi:hypothetical protein
MMKRDNHVRRKREDLEQKKRDEEEASMLKSPQLATMKYRSSFPELSHDESFEALYRSRLVYQHRAVEREKIMQHQRSFEMNFAPKINAHSIKLAERRRFSYGDANHTQRQQTNVSMRGEGDRTLHPSDLDINFPASLAASPSIFSTTSRRSSSTSRSNRPPPSSRSNSPNMRRMYGAVAPDGTDLRASPSWGKRSKSADTSRRSIKSNNHPSKQQVAKQSAAASRSVQRGSPPKPKPRLSSRPQQQSPVDQYTVPDESAMRDVAKASASKHSGPYSQLIKSIIQESKANLPITAAMTTNPQPVMLNANLSILSIDSSTDVPTGATVHASADHHMSLHVSDDSRQDKASDSGAEKHYVHNDILLEASSVDSNLVIAPVTASSKDAKGDDDACGNISSSMKKSISMIPISSRRRSKSPNYSFSMAVDHRYASSYFASSPSQPSISISINQDDSYDQSDDLDSQSSVSSHVMPLPISNIYDRLYQVIDLSLCAYSYS